jgi:hypothetical protein
MDIAHSVWRSAGVDLLAQPEYLAFLLGSSTYFGRFRCETFALVLLLLVVVLLLAKSLLIAQATNSRNLELCLSGKYPGLCDHTALTPEQRIKVIAAKIAEYLNLCMVGKYPALCDPPS